MEEGGTLVSLVLVEELEEASQFSTSQAGIVSRHWSGECSAASRWRYMKGHLHCAVSGLRFFHLQSSVDPFLYGKCRLYSKAS